MRRQPIRGSSDAVDGVKNGESVLELRRMVLGETTHTASQQQYVSISTFSLSGGYQQFLIVVSPC